MIDSRPTRLKPTRRAVAILFPVVLIPLFFTLRTWSSAGEFLPPPRLTRTSEAIFRRSTIAVVRPDCPHAAIPDGTTTVGIVAVSVGSRGRVVNAEPLEPLSGPIADAMRLAAERSRFQPLPEINGRPELLTATLTFYFSRHGTQCDVLEPSEAGYVGRWPAARTTTPSAASRAVTAR